MAMFSKLDITGYHEQQPDTTHVVSMWNIPGGRDYTDATVMYLFYSNKDEADKFALKWNYPPEMPVVMTLAEYETVQRKEAERRLARQELIQDDFLYAQLDYEALHAPDC